MRKWENYLNSQKYSECQLVTAINAYYFFTGKTIKSDSDGYEKLVDLCGARHGTATCIEKVHRKLGLKAIGYSNNISTWIPNTWDRIDVVKRRSKGIYPKNNRKKIIFHKEKLRKIELPIEITVWHKRTGFHSVLIVDHCLKTECFQIANFRHVTSAKGWMFVEDLYMYINSMNKGWCFRLFGRRKNG